MWYAGKNGPIGICPICLSTKGMEWDSEKDTNSCNNCHWSDQESIAKRGPIIEFADEAQANECLKEWQTRLFLTDWIITVELHDLDRMPDGRNLGYCTHYETTQVAHITIARLTEQQASGELYRPCHERVLIHELMHCKRLSFSSNTETVEQATFYESEHTHIEQMAKSLLMAKYNIGLDWFKNF